MLIIIAKQELRLFFKHSRIKKFLYSIFCDCMNFTFMVQYTSYDIIFSHILIAFCLYYVNMKTFFQICQDQMKY